MKNLFLTLATCFIVMLTACTERRAKVSNPKQYTQGGVSFDYPENWRVTDDEQTSGLRYIFVETPGDAILIFQIYGLENDMPVLEYAQSFSQGAEEEIPIGSFSSPVFKQLSENRIEERVSLSVLNQVIPHKREYLKFICEDEVCYLTFQVAEEDLAKTQEGFDLIANSFEYKQGHTVGD